MYLSQVYCIHHPRLTGKHSLSKSCTSHCSMQRFLGPFNHTPPSTHTHTRDKETSGLALSALSVPHPELPPTNSSMSLFHYHVPFRHQTSVEAFHARDCTSTLCSHEIHATHELVSGRVRIDSMLPPHFHKCSIFKLSVGHQGDKALKPSVPQSQCRSALQRGLPDSQSRGIVDSEGQYGCTPLWPRL